MTFLKNYNPDISICLQQIFMFCADFAIHFGSADLPDAKISARPRRQNLNNFPCERYTSICHMDNNSPENLFMILIIGKLTYYG